MSFDSLGLNPQLLRAVEEAGYHQPSPIQAKAIPAILNQRDVLAAAQTGTGKTAAFTLPILQTLHEKKPLRKKGVRALILTPTRELAAQIHESILLYSRFMKPKPSSAVVFGGVKINPQIERLSSGVDVLVACPGRLLDLVNQKAVTLEQVETLVLDEADRMLDMGFLRDIRKILAMLPKKRQNLLFSATFSKEIRALTETILVNPETIEVAPRNTTAQLIDQSIYKIGKPEKSALLIHLIKQHQLKQVLVFTVTKHMANRVTQRLEKAGIRAAAIHGNKSQNARTSALSGFKEGSVEVLVATDVAARGIDIAELPNVINFELPKSAPDYVHRIGRTGRAGAQGQAMSLVCPEENSQLKQIERLIRSSIKVATVEGFDPAAIQAESEPVAPKNQGNQQRPKRQRSQSAKQPANARNQQRKRRPNAQQRNNSQGNNAPKRNRAGKQQKTGQGNH